MAETPCDEPTDDEQTTTTLTQEFGPGKLAATPTVTVDRFLYNAGTQPTERWNSDGHEQFTFVALTEDIADEVRGEIPDVDGTPVVYVGETAGNLHASQGTVPDDVRARIEARDLTLVTNVKSDWSNWEGRPRWSKTFVDVTDAQVA